MLCVGSLLLEQPKGVLGVETGRGVLASGRGGKPKQVGKTWVRWRSGLVVVARGDGEAEPELDCWQAEAIGSRRSRASFGRGKNGEQKRQVGGIAAERTVEGVGSAVRRTALPTPSTGAWVVWVGVVFRIGFWGAACGGVARGRAEVGVGVCSQRRRRRPRDFWGCRWVLVCAASDRETVGGLP